MNEISKTAKILKNVTLGKNVKIEDYVIIGIPPMKKKEGDLSTIVGDNSVIRSHSVIYAGNKIGNNFQTGNNVNIREENEIGNNVSIGTKTVIEFKTVIKDNARIHSQAFIPEYCVLEEDCWIGPNVVLTNAKYPKSLRAKDFLEGVVIGKGAKIGANSTILPGVKIGKNALVGAGSVVTRNVTQGKIVAGNPAKVIGEIDSCKYPDGKKAYGSEK
ncbi:MAG: N-acetyltransferase [Candidatus Thermoplasmatota archaeon]|nr:N-acetyltransferase [Candidatus Thermoplasmatota archaeon]